MSPPPTLTAQETRVLGCLLEKQRTTPDAYPLSLNALRLACNQTTNREPVVEYEELTIRAALHRLERKGLVRLASGAGSRASKYRHLLAQALPLDDGEQAVLCVTMLRGAQTPGELKQRTERMHHFEDLHGVGHTLEAMIDRGLLERLARRPGQKEERYRQLLEEDEEAAEREPATTTHAPGESHMAPPPPAGSGTASLQERVERLEREVAELRGALERATTANGAGSRGAPAGEATS